MSRTTEYLADGLREAGRAAKYLAFHALPIYPALINKRHIDRITRIAREYEVADDHLIRANRQIWLNNIASFEILKVCGIGLLAASFYFNQYSAVLLGIGASLETGTAATSAHCDVALQKVFRNYNVRPKQVGSQSSIM